MFVFVCIILIIVLLALLFVMFLTDMTNKGKENDIINKMQAVYEKYGAPKNEIRADGRIPAYECVSGGGILSDRGTMPTGLGPSYCVWRKDNVIRFLRAAVDECIDVKVDDIVQFSLVGSESYVSEVSGGGGGGSSIGGAIAGGILAGGAGAVIGSRKSTAPITTNIKHIDNQRTLLVIKDNGTSKSIVFDGGKLYDKLLKICPEKEISVAQSNVPASADYEERLSKLKELYEKKLISEEEYELKKDEIIKSI